MEASAVARLVREVALVPAELSRDDLRVEKLAACCAGTAKKARAWLFRFGVSRDALTARVKFVDCTFRFVFPPFLSLSSACSLVSHLGFLL